MEGFCGHSRFVAAIHSVERDVAIHSRNKREGTWWTYQEIAFGKHEEIFRCIAVKMMNVYSRTQTLVGLFRYSRIIGGQIDVNVLILMYCGEPVDMVRIGIVIEEKLAITSRVKEIIYNTLNKNNIEIPFPQRDLHIKQQAPSNPL